MAQFTNQAQLTYNNRTINSNTTTGNLVEALSASKDAVRSNYSQSNTLAYVINLINSGAVALTGISLSDNLGGYEFNAGTVYPLNYVNGSIKFYVNGVLQSAPSVTAGPPLVISGITVPAGGNASLVYEASLTEYAPMALGSTIENTATITGTGITSPLSASATVNASSDPELAIVKSVEPATVSGAGTLTYTFVIQNYGNTEASASANAVVSDTFSPVLGNLTVSLDGSILSVNDDYTYDSSGGVFATVAGRITVPKATFTQNEATGAYTVTPGTTVLTVSGTV